MPEAAGPDGPATEFSYALPSVGSLNGDGIQFQLYVRHLNDVDRLLGQFRRGCDYQRGGRPRAPSDQLLAVERLCLSWPPNQLATIIASRGALAQLDVDSNRTWQSREYKSDGQHLIRLTNPLRRDAYAFAQRA